MNTHKTAIWLLRIGIAFSLLYAALGGFLNPDAWIGYFPAFVQNIAPPTALLTVWSIVEIILALLLLLLPRVFYPALVSAVLLFGVTLVNLTTFDVVFRDVSIGLAALALALFEYQHKYARLNNTHTNN